MADIPSAVVNIIVHSSARGDVITVSPTLVRAKAGDVVQWQAPGADSFVLVFRDGAAVAHQGKGKGKASSNHFGRGVEVESALGEMKNEPWMVELFRAGLVAGTGPVAWAEISGTPGVHQYQLAVRRGDRLLLDVGCPEVIIQ